MLSSDFQTVEYETELLCIKLQGTYFRPNYSTVHVHTNLNVDKLSIAIVAFRFKQSWCFPTCAPQQVLFNFYVFLNRDEHDLHAW